MRLGRNASARWAKLELRLFNDGPPLFWGVVSVLAHGLLSCMVAGSLLSLQASLLDLAEVFIAIGFLGTFVVFATVMFGGAVRYLLPGLARLARIGDDDGPSLRTVPRVVAGIAAVSLVVTAVICISSLDRMGAGSAEEVGGRYFLINHGDRTEVSRSGYVAARAANSRAMAVVGCVFLGVGAVAAGNRRNLLREGFTDDPEDDTATRWLP